MISKVFLVCNCKYIGEEILERVQNGGCTMVRVNI